MVGTRAGFLDGQEVVEVRFAPKTLPFDRLLAHAEQHECARTVFVTGAEQLAIARGVVGDRARQPPGEFRADEEPKYYLFQSELRAIPMTELQAVRVNARIRVGKGEELLSPRQRELLAMVRANPDAGWPNLVGRDLREGWEATEKVHAKLTRERR